jgi:hypothetical protein
MRLGKDKDGRVIHESSLYSPTQDQLIRNKSQKSLSRSREKIKNPKSKGLTTSRSDNKFQINSDFMMFGAGQSPTTHSKLKGAEISLSQIDPSLNLALPIQSKTKRTLKKKRSPRALKSSNS